MMKDWERERIAMEAEGRQRHLRDCERYRVRPGGRRTTPGPSVAVEAIVPELAGWAKTAVVLHPRFGPEPAPDASKLGGSFAWPEREPWPECETHAIPYVTALQLRSEDFPEMAFPAGTDLFQLLWCPRDHELWFEPSVFWRRRADLAGSRAPNPAPRDAFMSYVPVPCVLLPERVKEYPPIGVLPDELRDKLLAGLKGHELREKLLAGLKGLPLPERIMGGYQLYCATLSVCPASKVGGYPSRTEDFEVPVCSCGSPMDYLLTIGGHETSRPRWLPLEEQHLFDGTARSTYGWADAHGLLGGYTAEFFLCRKCGGWPTRYVANPD